jgi:iron complex outermembrane receptor protein
MRNILIVTVFALFLILSKLNANQSDNIKDFETLLNDVSDIATKKSLNVDYLPSVVTVINAQTYEDAGIKNIGEALGMLPGIQVQISATGYTMTTLRGLKNPNAYLSDKIKVLIDGVAINNEISGTTSFYMDFPMQLVEKIEVLRGPNSTTYGSGAFYGTVNVITKLGNSKKENQLYFGAGSYDYTTAGANVYNISKNWKIFADGYYQKNNKSLGVEGTSVGTDEEMRDVSVGFRALNGGFEFLTRYKESRYGNFYSFEADLDPIPTNPKHHTNKYFFAQASYKKDINDYKLETKANYSLRALSDGGNIETITKISGKFSDVGVAGMNEGFYFTRDLKEQNMETELTLTFPKIKSHEIVSGVGARYVKILKDDYFNSVEDAITKNRSTILASPNYSSFTYRESKEPAFWANPTTSFIKANQDRTIVYGYLEDLIALNRDIDIVLGARVDNYSDVGTTISKRVSIVYRADDKTIFKLLYGSAFRAPTFTEAYANGHINYRAGDKDIKPEETNTYEAVAIYKPNFNNKFSLNIFYSQLHNVIDLEEYSKTIVGYQNYGNRASKGVEFEYNFHTKKEHNLYLNASYVEAEYTTPPEEDSVATDQLMPDISRVMLKGIYVYSPTDKLSFGTVWRYFSSTTQSELNWISSDTRVKAQHIFDETITYRFTSNSKARFGVKNIFNADVRDPSYYYNTDGGIKREGRNWLLSYLYKF